jgi:hypothetical protein
VLTGNKNGVKMLLTGFLYGFYRVFILCCFVVWSKDGSGYVSTVG